MGIMDVLSNKREREQLRGLVEQARTHAHLGANWSGELEQRLKDFNSPLAWRLRGMAAASRNADPVGFAEVVEQFLLPAVS